MANLILLQSHDKFDIVIELDVETGIFRPLSKTSNPGLIDQPLRGHATILDGTLVALYRSGGTLHLRHGNFDVPITSNVESTLSVGTMVDLTLRRDDCVLTTITFPVIDWRIPGDTTPFIEEEDFNFGIFVHNVLSNLARRERLYFEATD